MITKNSIENLKNRLDIVDVVGGYIELKKSGANFKAVCPFHDEKTPSMIISPSKQIYHCFGCGAGGDSIKFVMDYEHLAYPEALEKLAQNYNFSLEYEEDGKIKKQANKKILETLNEFYRKKLDQNQNGLEYLKSRGVSEASIEKFEIGWAPSSNETLRFLKSCYFDIKECIDVGVAGIGERGEYFARFIDRITFAIFSQSGKLVGFGGRTISGHPAKYVNSPQSQIFNKSSLLYGYHLAKNEIFKSLKIIVTEGYLDVIMLHQAGFSNVVATLGTALTKEHLPLLKKGGAKVILAYDGDEAGINAAFKASILLLEGKINGGVVIFEGKLDPADMVKLGKISQLKEMFMRPKPIVEFCVEQIVKKIDLSDPHQKQNALKEVQTLIDSLEPLLQEEYRAIAASMIKVPVHYIKIKSQKTKIIPQIQKNEDIAELGVIKTLLENKNMIDFVLDIVDADIFNAHFEEFSTLLRGDYENPILVGITLRNDIKTLTEEHLKKQLSFFLSNYYKKQLEKIKKSDLESQKKNIFIRKIQDKIIKLKNGELVEYESFGII